LPEFEGIKFAILGFGNVDENAEGPVHEYDAAPTAFEVKFKLAD
jgi:hypothetical protein